MYACILQIGTGFFGGVCKQENRQLTFRDPPHPGGQAPRLNNGLSDLLSRFAEEIASVRVLDPACGSGNFLSVSMQQLLNLEKEVIAFASEVGLPTCSPKVGPEQVSRGRGQAPS
jgi:hypothetical protein